MEFKGVKCQWSPGTYLRTTAQAWLALPVLIGVLALALSSGAATPLGSAFTYQGQLRHNGGPATGSFDLEFNLYDGPDPLTDMLIATDTKTDVPVSNGLFTVELDFGSAAFDGDARWIQIGVREDSASPFTFVSPLQPLTAAPYAVFALSGPPVAEVPPGAIVMWSGPLASIPAGWALCDGTNGTPNLADRFVLSVSSGEDPGATGGSSSHGHSINSAGDHTHNGGTTAISNNNLTINHGSDFEGVRQEHTHNFTTTLAGGHTHSAGSADHLPPYFKLAFIMKLP